MATQVTGYVSTAFALVDLNKAAEHELLDEIVRNIKAGKSKPAEDWNEDDDYKTLVGNGCFVARFSFDTGLVYKVTRVRSDRSNESDADSGIEVLTTP